MKTQGTTTYFCNATIERQDGSIQIKRWKGKRGAGLLKGAMRKHLKADPSVKDYQLGNVWSVNNYGAH